MSRTIVSWTRFCEWVQGKKVLAESDDIDEHRTTVNFTDGTAAVFHSVFEMRFGEKTMEPPHVEIIERGP